MAVAIRLCGDTGVFWFLLEDFGDCRVIFALSLVNIETHLLFKYLTARGKASHKSDKELRAMNTS
jgi:hypothetical protein